MQAIEEDLLHYIYVHRAEVFPAETIALPLTKEASIAFVPARKVKLTVI